MPTAHVPAPILRWRTRADSEGRPPFLPICLAVLLLLLLTFPAAPSPPPPAAVTGIPLALRDDPRLDTPVTVAEVYRPLPDLLTSMQRQCHVKLAANPAVADDWATLFLDAKPA